MEVLFWIMFGLFVVLALLLQFVMWQWRKSMQGWRKANEQTAKAIDGWTGASELMGVWQDAFEQLKNEVEKRGGVVLMMRKNPDTLEAVVQIVQPPSGPVN